MSYNAEYLEIIRQYESALVVYKKALADFRFFKRHLPSVLNITQKKELAYQKMLHSEACKEYYKRREELRNRMIEAGYGPIKFGQKDIVEVEKEQAIKRRMFGADPVVTREAIKMMRGSLWADEDIMHKLNITKEELQSLEGGEDINKLLEEEEDRIKKRAEIFTQKIKQSDFDKDGIRTHIPDISEIVKERDEKKAYAIEQRNIGKEDWLIASELQMTNEEFENLMKT